MALDIVSLETLTVIQVLENKRVTVRNSRSDLYVISCREYDKDKYTFSCYNCQDGSMYNSAPFDVIYQYIENDF